MRVLLSIKPEFALKIFDGSKRYEYRRTIFKRGEVTTVVVYASNTIKKVMGSLKLEKYSMRSHRRFGQRQEIRLE